MSTNPAENTNEQVTQEQKQSDKEYNFAQIRKQLDQERSARQQAELEKAQLVEQINRVASQKMSSNDDDDGDDEPYVDKKRLKKELVKVVQKTTADTETLVQNAVQRALSEERRDQWLKSHPDYKEVMDHAQALYDKDPELGDTILKMPDEFERAKLAYKNIKLLGLHKKEEPKSTIQETVDRNQRNVFYQPSSAGSPPYAQQGDFSPAGQKNSYEKMKDLQRRLRLG